MSERDVKHHQPLLDGFKTVLRKIGLLDLAYAVRERMFYPVRNRLHAEGVLPWTEEVPATELLSTIPKYFDALRARNHSFGHYLEFGVSRGTSLACMWRAKSTENLEHLKIIGFDSFEGLPQEAADYPEAGWKVGEFRSTIGATRRYLKQNGVDLEAITLVKGWFADTLNADTIKIHNINKASIIMVDCDIYPAAVEVLNFVEPLIGDEAVIMFDDWYCDDIGEKKAFAEFQEKHPDLIASALPSYGAEDKVFLLTRTAV